MFEKHEGLIIFALIGLAVYYFFKNFGQSSSTANPLSSIFGSLVNPTQEPGAATPFQSTTPVVFRPAQPSSGSQMIRVGQFSNVPGPAQNIPVTRYNLYGYPGATYGGSGATLTRLA